MTIDAVQEVMDRLLCVTDVMDKEAHKLSQGMPCACALCTCLVHMRAYEIIKERLERGVLASMQMACLHGTHWQNHLHQKILRLS